MPQKQDGRRLSTDVTLEYAGQIIKLADYDLPVELGVSITKSGLSQVLAGSMSAVAVVGAKLSNNQHKVDQAWNWLERIWIAWAVINGIGASGAGSPRPMSSGRAVLTEDARCISQVSNH